MKEEARIVAKNHWPEILVAAGISDKSLRDVHGPCPMCGGKDRFRFDNKDGTGSYYCNGCGHGDGFKLLMGYRDFTFKDAAEFVRTFMKGCSVDPKPMQSPVQHEESDEEKLNRLRAHWHKAKRVSKGDPVWTYLTHTRQLPIDGVLPVLRYHASLPYVEKGKFIGYFPAMLAIIQNQKGEVTGIHRTYLTRDGRKADVSYPKKTEKARSLAGSAIRLFKHGKKLAISEGIETALAVHALTGLPVWATVNKVLMEKLILPFEVEELFIYADHDLPDKNGKRAGQDASKDLAERLRAEGRKVRIILPAKGDSDFADIWCAHLKKSGRKVA